MASNIQGSINQLLTIGTVGIRMSPFYEQRQKEAPIKKEINLLEKKISKGREVTEDYQRLATAKEKLFDLKPSQRRMDKAEEAQGEATKRLEKTKKEKSTPQQRAWEALAKEQDRIRNSKIIRGGTTYGQRETYNV